MKTFRQHYHSLVEAAFKNAEEDYKARLLTETRIDAQNVIAGIAKAMKETPDILNIEEKEAITVLINSLQNIIYSNNREEILTKIEELNKSAADFIEKHLNSGAKSLLEGRHINDL